jgi:hypothetical protein
VKLRPPETEPARVSAAVKRSDERTVGDEFARLDLVEASFAEATRRSGRILERDFTIAGSNVRFRSTSVELLELLSRAFTHLTTAPGSAELTIHLWESASAGISSPPVPDVRDEVAPGAVFNYGDRRVRFSYRPGTGYHERLFQDYPHELTPALGVFDSEHGSAWYWVADPRRIPYWEQATPMVHLLDWWLRDRGLYMLHAGAIGTAAGGVLLVGKSGSGKSTSTLSALQSELGYVGDDHIAVSFEPRPWVHGLFSSGKLMPDHVQRLPFLRSALPDGDPPEGSKAVVYVHEHWPKNISPGFPLKAILAPRVTPGLIEARLVETTAVAGLAALAPSTVLQLPSRGQESLLRMRSLVQAVPSYRLELGSDVASIPGVVSDLLRQLDGT